MSRQLVHRRPHGRGSFSWGRIPNHDRGTVSWRLFRRGIDGRVYAEMRTFAQGEDRRDIARSLWRMRTRLRDAVDAVDFAAMGIAA